MQTRSGFRGGGTLPLRDSTPDYLKGSPFGTILGPPFWAADPKTFLKPIYTIFDWGAHAKKHDSTFLLKI